MIRGFIPSDVSIAVQTKQLFILTRPFLIDSKWGNDPEAFSRWAVDPKKIGNVEEAN
jgi:hypothetical protein